MPAAEIRPAARNPGEGGGKAVFLHSHDFTESMK